MGDPPVPEFICYLPNYTAATEAEARAECKRVSALTVCRAEGPNYVVLPPVTE